MSIEVFDDAIDASKRVEYSEEQIAFGLQRHVDRVVYCLPFSIPF